METLPIELLDLICEDELTYRDMLSIPCFARTLTVGRRLDFMIKFGYGVNIRSCKPSHYIEWHRDGKLHRKDGPAEEYADGSKIWYRDGKRHREDGPAIDRADGDKLWYKDGKLHREDGPAIEYANGGKVWYRDDKLHREDGPAIEYANGSNFWYQDGYLCKKI
jgi:hypothetical protein